VISNGRLEGAREHSSSEAKALQSTIETRGATLLPRELSSSTSASSAELHEAPRVGERKTLGHASACAKRAVVHRHVRERADALNW
jgi:hypothetical protein